MESSCVRYDDLPHVSRLFLDYLYHFERLSSFYSHPPLEEASFQESAATLDFPDQKREVLVRALGVHNRGNPALDSLARAGTVAVVTGQQVGLFSGPAYTIYKALTAVRLARRLSERGIPAVPVFWLATEDHDFAEVGHCWVFDNSHSPVRLDAGGDGDGTQPAGCVSITASPVEPLRAALAGFPHGEEVAAMAGDAYQEGATFGEAFRKLLQSLLPDLGLLYLDPMLPEIRALTAPLIRTALEAAPDLSEALLVRTRELERLGYHGQVHVAPDTSLVFALEGGRRLALKRNGREYLGGGRRFSTRELMDRAETLSPNALLRPVVQDSILPTVAYVGGPAELAYLAQAQAIYQVLLGRMPVAVSRAGFTLLDGRSAKLMRRYQLGLPDFYHGLEPLRERMAHAITPPALLHQIEQTKAAVSAALDPLEHALGAFDVTLREAFQKSRSKIEYQIAKTARKAARQALVRDQRAAADAAYLYGLIYPGKQLQERVYSILPFLARHGLELVPALYENVSLECPGHRLMMI